MNNEHVDQIYLFLTAYEKDVVDLAIERFHLSIIKSNEAAEKQQPVKKEKVKKPVVNSISRRRINQ